MTASNSNSSFNLPSASNSPWKIKMPSYHIDMTPYVDVIMLLLTFFIMTTVLNKPQVMQVNLPKGDEPVRINMANVVFLRLSEKGDVYLSKGREDGSEENPVIIPGEKLKSRLESLFAENKEMAIILKFHRKAKYENMIYVLDETNKSKMEKRYSFGKMDESDIKILKSAGG